MWGSWHGAMKYPGYSYHDIYEGLEKNEKQLGAMEWEDYENVLSISFLLSCFFFFPFFSSSLRLFY